MMVRNLTRLFRWTLLVPVAIGGCECQRDIAADKRIIDRDTMIEKDPTAEAPEVNFPYAIRTTDPGLNRFITHALNVCRDGDYDRFRQLFSTAHTPPEHADFERIWYGVEEVEIQGVYKGPDDPPTWYASAVVRLRKPDGKNRQEREVVVAVFQEEGEWRLGTPPQGIVRRIRASERGEEGNGTGGD